MKRLALALALFVSLMLTSAPSFAEWKEAASSSEGDVFYAHTKFRQHNGLIYFWTLSDYLKPIKYGYFSVKSYWETDCRGFRKRALQYISYKQPMGEGPGESRQKDDSQWQYPSPDSINASVLTKACELAKNR